MADLRISELAALAGINLAANDLLPVVDVSASETKKITVTDFTGRAITLIADATIPGAKILFGANQVPGTAVADLGITTGKLASKSVSAAKLGDESTVDLVTSLPAVGAFVGQLALNTTDLRIYCWNGSTWATIKASGSLNTFTGSGAGIVNVVVTTTGDNVSISTTLDDTASAGQFLAGPSAGAGAVSYRRIIGTDLPTPTTSAKGGVIVNGEGLRMDGDTLELNNDVVANSTTYQVVQYSNKGLITAGRNIAGADLPAATAGALGGVRPGTGLTVAADGVLNHTVAITPGTAAKVTFDAQGHITGSSNLLDADIPNISATKLTAGTLDMDRLANNSIAGTKLANASTVKFGGAGSTAGVVTFPVAEFQGQYFFDALNGDLYLYDGAAWQPITITAGELIYAGTYNANTNRVKSLTAAGTAAGLVVGSALPAASNNNLRYYLVVADSGTGTAPAPAVALAPPDMIVSNGNAWELVDVSNGIAGQLASNISFTPYGGVAATNVQTAIQELEDNKLSKAGGTITGNLEIGSSGSLTFEGITPNANETTLAVVDPTADRTITLPDASGTVVLSGAIVNADISASAAIADTKLATISTAGKVANSATTAASANTASAIVARDSSGNFTAGTITATTFSGSGASLTNVPAGQLSGTVPSGVLGNSSLFVGTTSVALNRSSANQALTGISSIALPGVTSGTITLTPAAVAGSATITLPATTGTVITTGDTSTVTNTMLAGSIADSKLNTISTAGKVTNSATTATNSNVASTIVARDGSGNFAAGQISGTGALVGTGSALTNVFSISTQLTPAVQIEGNTGSAAAVSITRQTSAAANLILQRGVTGTAVAADDAVGQVNFNGFDGSNYINAALIRGVVDGTPGTNDMPGRLVFSTTADGASSPTERMRIDSNGGVGIGGTAASSTTLRLIKNITGATSAFALNADGQIQSDVTSDVSYFRTSANTVDAAFSLGSLTHYQAAQGTVTGGTRTAPTNQYGFWARASLTGATNNCGFYSDIASGTGRWNFYANGTADSYFASNNFIWANGGSERARIDSFGRVLVGTSTSISTPLSSSTLGGSWYQQRATGQGESSAFWSAYSTTSTVAPNILLGKSRGALDAQGLVSDGDSLGRVVFLGSDGQAVGTNAGFIRAAVIEGQVDGTASAGDMPGRIVLSTTADGASSPTERLRITNDGVMCYGQAAPVSYAAAATLVVGDLKNGLIQYTGAAATLTLPTGTLTEGGFSGIYTNMTFEWSVINTGSGTCTIGAGTGHTIVGGATIAAGASGRFASRRTAANTFVSYRLS